jgi:hypothetical protein
MISFSFSLPLLLLWELCSSICFFKQRKRPSKDGIPPSSPYAAPLSLHSTIPTAFRRPRSLSLTGTQTESKKRPSSATASSKSTEKKKQQRPQSAVVPSRHRRVSVLKEEKSTTTSKERSRPKELDRYRHCFCYLPLISPYHFIN